MKKSRKLIDIGLPCLILIVLTMAGIYRLATEVGREVRIENGVRVMMHERSRYSIFVPEGNKLTPYEIKADPSEISIIPDVPAGQLMWAKMLVTKINRATYQVEIHIRSEQDIEGGGWDHGKNGRGTTNVLN